MRRFELPPDTPELMTTPEVADALGIHPNTVTTWANHNWLAQVMTLGGQRRFPKSDVEALLNEGVHPSQDYDDD
jgi:excisionase family DNA binding protein